jgi:hypothetical protein
MICLALSLLAGCSSIAEYDSLWSWRAEVVSLPDLSPLGSVAGLEEGVAVLPIPGGIFLVSSLEGGVYRCSAGEMAVLDTWQLSDAPSGGCRGMAASPCSASFYLIASTEWVYEVDSFQGSILQQVMQTDAPSGLGDGLDDEHIYLADGASGWVYEIFCPDNYAERAVQCDVSPDVLEPLDVGPGYILLGCSDSRGTVYFLRLDSFETVRWETGAACSDLAAMGDSTWAAARPQWSGAAGSVLVCDGVEYGISARELSLGGHPQRVCWGEDDSLLYVGARTADGSTLVSAWSPESSKVVAEVELDGFLRDMAMTPGGGRLIVLLYE